MKYSETDDILNCSTVEKHGEGDARRKVSVRTGNMLDDPKGEESSSAVQSAESGLKRRSPTVTPGRS